MLCGGPPRRKVRHDRSKPVCTTRVKRQSHLFCNLRQFTHYFTRHLSTFVSNLRCISGFLREDEVLNHAFFHRTPAKVFNPLAKIITHDHVICVKRRVAALGTSAHLP